jgi:hypothetical protein
MSVIQVPSEARKTAARQKRSGESWSDFLERPTMEGELTDTTFHLILFDLEILEREGFRSYIDSQIEDSKSGVDLTGMSLEELEEQFDDLTDVPDRGGKEWVQIRLPREVGAARSMKERFDLKWEDYVYLCASTDPDPISPTDFGLLLTSHLFGTD